MSNIYLSESLEKKWAPILDNSKFPTIADKHRRDVTGILLENTQQTFLSEAAPYANPTSVSTGGIANWEPVLINLVRRAMPSIVAYDIFSVQPMTGPVGQIFAMKSQYADDNAVGNWNEALFDTVRTDYSGVNTNGTDQTSDAFVLSGSDYITKTTFAPGTGLPGYDNSATAPGFGPVNAAGDTNAENWGYSDGPAFNQMSFTIEKATVTAVSRALRADYTLELEQDLKSVRNMSVEGELTNILSTEITLELNREMLYTMLKSAKLGMQSKATGKGLFDADTDSDGRWSVEKWKGLLFNIEREANTIAKQTRRGKGNFILCTSDVASALAMAQVLDYTPALQQNLVVDDTGSIYAGMLAGRYKVFIDPFWAGSYDYFCVGYKGNSEYDAGIFYCPYIPLQLLRTVNPTTFQPGIAFKCRYGIVANPFTTLTAGTNVYYRKTKVSNLM